MRLYITRGKCGLRGANASGFSFVPCNERDLGDFLIRLVEQVISRTLYLCDASRRYSDPVLWHLKNQGAPSVVGPHFLRCLHFSGDGIFVINPCMIQMSPWFIRWVSVPR